MEIILRIIKSLFSKVDSQVSALSQNVSKLLTDVSSIKQQVSKAQRSANTALSTAEKKLNTKNPVVQGSLAMDQCETEEDNGTALGLGTVAMFNEELVSGRYNRRAAKYTTSRTEENGNYSASAFYFSSEFEIDQSTGRLSLVNPRYLRTTEDGTGRLKPDMYFTSMSNTNNLDRLYITSGSAHYSGGVISRLGYRGKVEVVDADGYAVEVGNGTADDARSTAHTLDWDGNAWFAGDIYVGGNGQDDENAKKLATLEDLEAGGSIPHIGDNGNWWIGDEDTGVSATVTNKPLTFGGAASGTYDGSSNVYVNIPKGGNASVWNYERTLTTEAEAFTVSFPAALGKFATLNFHFSIPCADLMDGTSLYAELGGGQIYGFGSIPIYADSGTSGFNLYLMRWNDTTAFMSAALSEFTQNARPGACTATLEHNNATSLKFKVGRGMLPTGTKIEAWGVYSV